MLVVAEFCVALMLMTGSDLYCYAMRVQFLRNSLPLRWIFNELNVSYFFACKLAFIKQDINLLDDNSLTEHASKIICAT